MTERETRKLIDNLANSASFSHDLIDSMAIKMAADSLVNPLTHIINLSLRLNKFARKWKLSKLIPLLKSKDLDRLSTSSYRPVSVLSTVSKLVERAAQEQLLTFLETSEQLNQSNHAYRRSHSTTTTLGEILDEMYQGVEGREMSSLMAVDQTAAFDCVSHIILLKKLKMYSIGENARSWVKDYLEGRTQYVALGRAKSRMEPIKRGVPQGSVLGPLLFAIHTNEMTEIVKRNDCRNLIHNNKSKLFGEQCHDCGILSLYADDLTYIVGSRNREDNQRSIRRNLVEIGLFLDENELAINQPKTQLTECMLKQKKGRTPGIPPSLFVEKSPGVVEEVSDKKYSRVLGANIQSNLLWQEHLETGKKALFPGIRRHLGMLKHLGRLIPLKSRLSLARGMVLSRMTYLMPLWGGAAECHLKKAQIILNNTARWATGLTRRAKIMTLMETTGWLTIKEQIRTATATQTWKLVHLNKPERMRSRYTLTADLKLEIPPPRLLFSENCYRSRASREWNQLSAELRQIDKLATFKRLLKRLILEDRKIPPDHLNGDH